MFKGCLDWTILDDTQKWWFLFMENHPKNGGFGVPPHDFGNLHMTSGGMNIRGEVVAMIEVVILCIYV